MNTRKEEGKGLGWRDYIALFIAMLTTTLLPILILILVLIVAVIVLVFIVKSVGLQQLMLPPGNNALM